MRAAFIVLFLILENQSYVVIAFALAWIIGIYLRVQTVNFVHRSLLISILIAIPA